MCGGGSVRDLSGLNQVPLWIIHGTADNAVTVAQSDKVVAAMREAAGPAGTMRLAYNRVPGMNHSRPARMFYLDESYEWLFRHTLKDKSRKIFPTFAIENAMQGAYSGLKSTRGNKQTTASKVKRGSKNIASTKPKGKQKRKSSRKG